MYQRVLVAVDGSPWSDTAAAYAIALASRTGAILHILSVSTTPAVASMPDAMGGADEIVLEAVEHHSLGVLAQVSAQAEDAGVAYEALSKWGHTSEMILHTAAEEQCDLIVLGSRALTGWKRLMMGDVSNAVTAKAQQPVLVIKPSLPPVPNTPLWRRVLVATGGSPWSDAAVDHAISLAQAQKLEMCVLYVETGRPQHDDDLAVVASEGNNILALAEARALAAGVSCETHLVHGHRPAVILETATQRECDVIILGSRGMSGWKRLMLGSVSNAVAAKATLPVLIVKRFFSGVGAPRTSPSGKE